MNRLIKDADVADLQAAVLIFEVTAFDVALRAAIAAGAIIAAIAAIVVAANLRADDGADSQSADDADGDLAVLSLRRLRRNDDGQVPQHR